MSDEDYGNMQMREVSVEELLPRQEIRVDLKSVAELIEGQKVLITGSAGSIGSEMVRQIAQFKPAKMMLIGCRGDCDQHQPSAQNGGDFPYVPS